MLPAWEYGAFSLLFIHSLQFSAEFQTLLLSALAVSWPRIGRFVWSSPTTYTSATTNLCVLKSDRGAVLFFVGRSQTVTPPAAMWRLSQQHGKLDQALSRSSGQQCGLKKEGQRSRDWVQPNWRQQHKCTYINSKIKKNFKNWIKYKWH